MSFICDCLAVSEQGRLTIGGADVTALAREYGTPLYIMDEDEIRKNCRSYINALRDSYPGEFAVAYASKALSFTYIYSLMSQEGLGADVVSGGELFTALRGGMKPESIYFHGNNKTINELEYALEAGVGRIVVDNREELERLSLLASSKGITAGIQLRVKPGIDAHTHDFVQTGKIDSKFGVALETGEALEMVRLCAKLPGVKLHGIHCHIGSQIFESEPFELTVRVMMGFMKTALEETGEELTELNLGGGFGIRYIASHEPRPLDEVVKVTAEVVTQTAKELGLKLPYLTLEPGRSMVGSAGITVYTVGSVKKIPSATTYVAVDGGMTDNPRYALYGSVYDAVLPERPLAERVGPVTIAGRCCESGDVVARDVNLPEVKAGDLLAVLATGAYNYSMASNYNRLPRPPIVMVSGGEPRLAVRRETYEDIVGCDVQL